MTPARRGRSDKSRGASGQAQEPSEPERRSAIGWTQRLRRVFGIDIERCTACGGTLRIIACIEDRAVIEKILGHLRRTNHCASGAAEARGPRSRAPPPASSLG